MARPPYAYLKAHLERPIKTVLGGPRGTALGPGWYTTQSRMPRPDEVPGAENFTLRVITPFQRLTWYTMAEVESIAGRGFASMDPSDFAHMGASRLCGRAAIANVADQGIEWIARSDWLTESIDGFDDDPQEVAIENEPSRESSAV